MGNTMSSSFHMILDMLVAMADLGYGGPWLWWTLATVDLGYGGPKPTVLYHCGTIIAFGV